MTRRVRRWALSICVATLIGVEVTLRVLYGLGDPPLAQIDPEIEYTLVPSRSYLRFGNRIEINAYGQRSAEFPATPPANERRALLIGDSVVYGNHFLDQTETIALQMATALADPLTVEGCVPRVIPVAVSSWGPVNQAAYLTRYGVFGAKTVLIIVSAHDLYDTPTHSRNLVPYRIWPSPTAVDDMLRAVMQRLPLFQGQKEPTQPPEARAAKSLAALDQIITLARAANATPRLIYHPTIDERAKEPAPARAIFQTWATQTAVPFTDLEVLLPEPGAYRDHIHPAPEGAARIAAALAGLLSSDENISCT